MYRKYYKHFLANLKKSYYLFYCFSIFISYLSVIGLGIYFVNLAFGDTLNNSSVLCFTCFEYNKTFINILLYLILLNVIFYLLNEIRFRVLIFKKIRNIKHGDEIIYILTLLILLILYVFL